MGTLPRPAGCEVLGGDSAVRWASATVFNITSAFQVCSWNPSTPQGQWALGGEPASKEAQETPP